MKTLIFDNEVFGHHLEYLHHMYVGALRCPDEQYVFVVPERFKDVSAKMEWSPAPNISFRYFDDKGVKGAWKLSKLLGKFVMDEKADKVFLITIMSFLPFLPFFISSKVKVSGIVYLIYLYRWNTSGLKAKILDVLKYILFSKCKIFHRIFLLNDRAAPRIVNRLFKTNKFEYLPDPFALPEVKNRVDLRKELGIACSDIVFLHFGGLSEVDRKGTMTILEALEKPVNSSYVFIFAGRVGKKVANRFYSAVEKAKSVGTRIFVFDQFCEYEFLCNLCLSSNAILIPYKNAFQSSGVIAYGATFGCRVIVPRKGLLGKIVRRYRLGVLLEDISACGIRRFLSENQNMNLFEKRISEKYIQESTINNFISKLK